jgi:hypothetical protein
MTKARAPCSDARRELRLQAETTLRIQGFDSPAPVLVTISAKALLCSECQSRFGFYLVEWEHEWHGAGFRFRYCWKCLPTQAKVFLRLQVYGY